MNALLVARQQKFEALRGHVFYRKYFKRLSAQTKKQCEDFILEHGAKDVNDWQSLVNRGKFGKSTAEDGMAADLLTACRVPV